MFHCLIVCCILLSFILGICEGAVGGQVQKNGCSITTSQLKALQDKCDAAVNDITGGKIDMYSYTIWIFWTHALTMFLALHDMFIDSQVPFLMTIVLFNPRHYQHVNQASLPRRLRSPPRGQPGMLSCVWQKQWLLIILSIGSDAVIIWMDAIMCFAGAQPKNLRKSREVLRIPHSRKANAELLSLSVIASNHFCNCMSIGPH